MELKYSAQCRRNQEIAKKLNISVNTVLTHKQRAKNELKNYIQYFALCMAIFLKKNEDPM